MTLAQFVRGAVEEKIFREVGKMIDEFRESNDEFREVSQTLENRRKYGS